MLILGYAGVIPFVVGAVMIWFDGPIDPYFFLQAFHIYSFLVLAFLCGIWWGIALAKFDPNTRLRLLIGSTIILVVSWLVMVFKENNWLIAFLAVAYTLIYIFEVRCSHLPLESDYLRMRRNLTIIVVLCHFSVFYYLYIFMN